VAEVDDASRWKTRQDDALHHTHERIRETEVGE
jgi:hypothetical protein